MTGRAETEMMFTEEDLQAAYRIGMKDGVTAYAWYHRDGGQQVGTTGKTLRRALEDIDESATWNQKQPQSLVRAVQEAHV